MLAKYYIIKEKFVRWIGPDIGYNWIFKALLRHLLANLFFLEIGHDFFENSFELLEKIFVVFAFGMLDDIVEEVEKRQTLLRFNWNKKENYLKKNVYLF